MNVSCKTAGSHKIDGVHCEINLFYAWVTGEFVHKS